jgi:DNA-binding MarR family transcriptional regulator
METRAAQGNDNSATGDYETGLTENDRLDLRVWLRLLTCTNLMERNIRQTMREQFDTTLPRFDILSQLDRTPDGLTMGDLSRRLMVSNGNVTGLVDRLVGEELVLREPSPHDRRAQLVRLTKLGKQAFAAMVPAHAALVKALFEGVSRKELDALHDLLGQLKDSLNDSNNTETGATSV